MNSDKKHRGKDIMDSEDNELDNEDVEVEEDDTRRARAYLLDGRRYMEALFHEWRIEVQDNKQTD